MSKKCVLSKKTRMHTQTIIILPTEKDVEKFLRTRIKPRCSNKK